MSYQQKELFKMKLPMYPHLKKIREALWANEKKSQVSVMVGSGFSLNANKVEDSFTDIALWKDLETNLRQELNTLHNLKDKNVLEIGELYVKEYGRTKLDEFLKQSIPDENYEPSSLHSKLLFLPWSDVYTTNYDTLLERAKERVYERNYQVVYDVNDIPSSIPPRIVKLHGSFPSKRPFIFTASDYDNYPIKFNPFVNMVQQSIMETHLVLIGFSGDDPNFLKWIEWVSSNLKEHMPNIYLLGFNESNRYDELKEKGITLIDFKDVYKDDTNPYKSMFKDIFEYFSYKEKKIKTEWPYKSYDSFNYRTLAHNKENYPGWVVMPEEIRRKNATKIHLRAEMLFDSLLLDTDSNICHINEILWAYEKFSIPIDFNLQQKLQEYISKVLKYEKEHLPILMKLLQEARLDNNTEDFDHYLNILEHMSDTPSVQEHAIVFEKALHYLNYNELQHVDNLLKNWNVDPKELDWGVKKAIVYSKMNQNDKAEELFKYYLEKIRNLLTIQNDNYHLLSLESVILNNLGQLRPRKEYAAERLRSLNWNFCNVKNEFNQNILSLKTYEDKSGEKTTNDFDPGRLISTITHTQLITPVLLSSFHAMQTRDYFNLSIPDANQYEIALKNLEILYPSYMLISKIQVMKLETIKQEFTRTFIYTVPTKHAEKIAIFLIKTLERGYHFKVRQTNAIEILSRIYFAISDSKIKTKIDGTIIEFIKSKYQFELEEIEVIDHYFERAFLDKNEIEFKKICEILLRDFVYVKSEHESSSRADFFYDPFVNAINSNKEIEKINLSEETINQLLRQLNNQDDYSAQESSLLRLYFLKLQKLLPLENYKKLINWDSLYSKDKKFGYSNFIPKSNIDRVFENEKSQKDNMNYFLTKPIPFIFEKTNDGMTSISTEIENYLFELRTNFWFKEANQKNSTIDCIYYTQWLEKFYEWWKYQKNSLLLKPISSRVLPIKRDYLSDIIKILKSNVLGSMPRRCLNKNHKFHLSQIFNDINNYDVQEALKLIPCFQRVGIDTQYNIHDILLNLYKDIDSNKTEMLYDYLYFISQGEVKASSIKIKEELLNIMKYSQGQLLILVIDLFKEAYRNFPKLFNENETLLLMGILKSRLIRFQNDKELLQSLNLEELRSLIGLVAYISKNGKIESKYDFSIWKNYVKMHRLPEIRNYTELFN